MSRTKLLIGAVAIGNTLIWYDIALFSFMAVPISKVFFSNLSADVALLVTFGTFAVSFLVRPLGALIIGSYADRQGRRRAMMLSTSLMMMGTLMIAVMPGYTQIGAAAPFGILVARVIQGLAAGGEFGAATAALAEHDLQLRGYSTSWQLATQTLSGAMAACAAMLLALFLTETELLQWGWRIPFLVGLLVGPVGLWIRSQMPTDDHAALSSNRPIYNSMTAQRGNLLIAVCLVAISTAVTYVLSFIPTYATRTLGVSPAFSNAAVMLGFLVQFPVALIVGHLSDKHGRLVFLWAGVLLLMASVVPIFWTISASGSPALILASILWLAVLKAVYSGALPAMLADIFPAANRATALAFSYSMAVAAFGGSAPAIISWLLYLAPGVLAPAYYLLVLSSVSFAALVVITRWRAHPGDHRGGYLASALGPRHCPAPDRDTRN